MKTLSIFFLLINLSSTTHVHAATKSAKSAKSKVQTKRVAPNTDLRTKHDFDDHGVLGQYQIPDEALAKIENDKGLNDLLGVRPHFKDRLSKASEQE